MRRSPRRRTGSTLVEFALIAPVLIAVIMGIMEFGWLVYSNMTIVNAAREGARSASLGNLTSTVTTLVANRAAPFPVTTTVTHTLDQGQSYVTTTNNASSNSAPFGSVVRVTVVYRFRPLTGFFPFLRNRDITARAEFGRE